MGVHFPTANTTTSLAVIPASGAETVLCTTPPLNLILDFAQVLLFWELVALIGAGSAGVTFRIRRGTTTAGALVTTNAQFMSVGAGNNAFWSGTYVDTPGAVAGQQYSLTGQSTGTTGAWTNQEISLTALVL